MNAIKNTIPERSEPSRYSARNMAKPVHFYYQNRDARSVKLIGDFNDWDPNAHPMSQRPDGWWFIELPLTHGHHHYLFVVDGAPALDPNASGSAEIGPVSKVSVVAVS
jgi:1,4-alpha-glucan branching enzyme